MSLQKQKTKDIDVYLVDNNSTDGSREYTKKKFPFVKIINTGENRGYTGGYNFACKELEEFKKKYEFYLFLNNDTESDMILLETLKDTFAKYPRIGIVVPAVVDANFIIDSIGGKYLFFTGTTLGNMHGEKYKRGNTLYSCFWASGSALAIRAQLFKKLGHFPNYFIYNEDVDISWKARNAGYDVVATDKTYIKHIQGGANTPKPSQLYLCEKNRLLSYWQNLPHIIFFFILPFFILLRLALVFYLTKTWNDRKAKIRGLYDSIICLANYKKTTYSIKRSLYVISKMNIVSKYL